MLQIASPVSRQGVLQGKNFAIERQNFVYHVMHTLQIVSRQIINRAVQHSAEIEVGLKISTNKYIIQILYLNVHFNIFKRTVCFISWFNIMIMLNNYHE